MVVWEIYQTDEVARWLDDLHANDPGTFDQVEDAVYALSCTGPSLGRPLVDTIAYSSIKNLKELRPGSSGASEVRVLFVFDPWRSAILLVAGGQGGGSGIAGTGKRSRGRSSCMRCICGNGLRTRRRADEQLHAVGS